MSRKPIIALIPSECEDSKTGFCMRSSYFMAIFESGGVPVYLPYSTDETVLSSYAESFDGFLFTGGIDIDPKYYSEAKLFESVAISKERDTFEFALFEKVFKTKKPILGICRGIQFLNVALGGSLFQNIENHMQKASEDNVTHEVKLNKNSRLFNILAKGSLKTNSFHHQAIKVLGKNLIVSAKTKDNTIEAIELPKEIHPFFLAVQWHPELFWKNDMAQKNLFCKFLSECQKNKN